MKLDTAPLMNPMILQKGMTEAQKSRIDETAQDFEAMFVTEMMRPMFDTVEVDQTFGGGKGEEIFRGMIVDEYGKSMAAQGNLGIADLVKAQLIEMQSAANKPAMAQNMHNEIIDVDSQGAENNVR